MRKTLLVMFLLSLGMTPRLHADEILSVQGQQIQWRGEDRISELVPVRSAGQAPSRSPAWNSTP